MRGKKTQVMECKKDKGKEMELVGKYWRNIEREKGYIIYAFLGQQRRNNEKRTKEQLGWWKLMLEGSDGEWRSEMVFGEEEWWSRGSKGIYGWTVCVDWMQVVEVECYWRRMRRWRDGTGSSWCDKMWVVEFEGYLFITVGWKDRDANERDNRMDV